ncbi:hypothetical protein GGS24DRAFT_510086 [Hypoxylon argillaceum]|nr:hypothetical protein GGS24DRAFT_510086 [Hypoxylon argillaceum]
MAWQDALGTAASISSLLQIACEVTKFGYSYFSNVRDAHVTREEYLRESRALVVVLLQLKQVLNSSDVQRHQDAATRARRAQLSAVMSDCERGLSKIEATLGKAVGFWRALWPLQQEQIRDHIKTFQQYRCMLDSFVSANVLATTTATLTKIDPLVLSHERTQLLFAFPQPDTISKPRVLTCPGTGKWFLDSVHYQQWLSKSSPVRFIWCHGPPGVGKSGLASLVIDELMEQQCQGQIHLCYFFSDFAAQEKQHLVGVLQCLVYQLIEQGDEEVVNCAKESLGHFDAFKSPNILAKVIAKIAGLAKPVFLVLDAEDELNCRERLRKYMLGFRNSGCRILITSRDKCPCESNTTTPSPMTNLELKMECPVEDIMKYATERFQQSPFQFQISVDLMNQIVQKSNSIFLIAHILIEHILKQTSVRDMKKVLEESPTELNEVFESSLRRINNQPPAFSRLAHRVIGWIINARQLLTVAAMTHGFAVEDGMDEVDQDGLTNSVLILRVCAGLVIIDETKTVRLVHTSVYEFFSAYKPSLEEVQVDIARSCIQYLCLKPMRNGPAKDVSELRNRLENLPFLHYASHHWGAHIRDESAEEQLRSLILGLLTHENTRWSAVQSLQFNSEVGNTTIAAEFFASIPTNQAALHLSAYWGLSSISRSLIHSGADETPCDSELWTPLHWAAANGHDRVVAVLIEAKCDLNAKDSEGWTPLFW